MKYLTSAAFEINCFACITNPDLFKIKKNIGAARSFEEMAKEQEGIFSEL